MARRNNSITQISNERKRQTVFYKRKKGLIKKAIELSLLCNMKILLYIFDSRDKKITQYVSNNLSLSDIFHMIEKPIDNAKDSFTNDSYPKFENGKSESYGGEDADNIHDTLTSTKDSGFNSSKRTKEEPKKNRNKRRKKSPVDSHLFEEAESLIASVPTNKSTMSSYIGQSCRSDSNKRNCFTKIKEKMRGLTVTIPDINSNLKISKKPENKLPKIDYRPSSNRIPHFPQETTKFESREYEERMQNFSHVISTEDPNGHNDNKSLWHSHLPSLATTPIAKMILHSPTYSTRYFQAPNPPLFPTPRADIRTDQQPFFSRVRSESNGDNPTSIKSKRFLFPPLPPEPDKFELFQQSHAEEELMKSHNRHDTFSTNHGSPRNSQIKQQCTTQGPLLPYNNQEHSYERVLFLSPHSQQQRLLTENNDTGSPNSAVFMLTQDLFRDKFKES